MISVVILCYMVGIYHHSLPSIVWVNGSCVVSRSALQAQKEAYSRLSKMTPETTIERELKESCLLAVPCSHAKSLIH